MHFVPLVLAGSFLILSDTAVGPAHRAGLMPGASARRPYQETAVGPAHRADLMSGASARRPFQAGPQRPARDTRQPPSTGTCTIRGRVVSADAGEPLRRARVSLSGAALKVARAVATDLDGRFQFVHVPPGRFTLFASKNGYVTLGYGQRRAFQAGRPLEITNGQILEGVDFALPRGAVISGRVFNDLQEPATGINVTAQRLRYVNGRRELVPAGREGQTDDLGQYRISGLPPGSYFVHASVAGGGGPQTPINEQGFVLGPTYHPAAAGTTEATPVTVRGGREAPSVDITLVPSRAASVSGTIYDSRGRPAAAASLTIRPAAPGLASILRSSYGTQANGAFRVQGLTPGSYTLHAVAARPDSPDRESADMPLTVGDQDLEGVLVTTAPNGSLRGRVVIDGDAKPAFAPTSLGIVASASLFSAAVNATVTAGWEFEMKNVEPARVTVGLNALPAGWAVKSVTCEGADVSETGTEVRAGSVSELIVTLTDKPASVSGAIAVDPRSSADDYTVVVFADDAARWKEGSRRIVAARPDQHGTYKVTGVPPGRYRVIALEYLDDGEQWNPEFLEWARPRATLIEMREGEPVALDLKVTRYAGQ